MWSQLEAGSGEDEPKQTHREPVDVEHDRKLACYHEIHKRMQTALLLMIR